MSNEAHGWMGNMSEGVITMNMRPTTLSFFRTALVVLLLCILPPGCVMKPSPKPRGIDPYTQLMYDFMKGAPLPNPAFALVNSGLPGPVDYAAYGTFRNIGTDQYEYEITNAAGLSKAVGAGIYPNEDGVVDEPGYQAAARAGLLDTDPWKALSQTNTAAAFFIWTQSPDDPGVKAFFTAVVLERANQIMPAIKAYHSVLVNFPRSACWAEDHSFVWYVAPAALGSIRRLCSAYPDLGLYIEGAEWSIEHGGDTDLDNDVFRVNPGRIVNQSLDQRMAALPDVSFLQIAETRGHGKVQLVRYVNGHWRMLVDGTPFVVRGVTYMPTGIGRSPQEGNLQRWVFSDKNGNGKADAAYDAWVDRNGNGKQDADELTVGDLQIMKDMGINAIRYFVPNGDKDTYDPSEVSKEIFRDMYRRFGIRVIACDFLGAYTVGSGASWEEGTDYTDPQQRQRMKEIVRQKVLDLKDEPWLLMWLLGNENNATFGGVNATHTNAGKEPRAWAEFLNEVAQMIHELDPDHPVALGNAEMGLADAYNRYAQAIDVFGINAYRGSGGFGNLWQEARRAFDRPVLITEYGCDAYFEGRGPDEAGQADYHRGCLRDIVLNQAGGCMEGNSIGGIIFEYLDEWWKAGDDPNTHAIKASGDGAFPDGKVHEEWFGIVGQGSGRNTPFERTLRQACEVYKNAWTGSAETR